MGDVFLALDERDLTNLEGIMKKRHNVLTTRDFDLTHRDFGYDYFLFDPTKVNNWKDFCEEAKDETRLIAVCDRDSLPDCMEMMDSGVVSYFIKPYQPRHVMNLVDRISRHCPINNKKTLLFVDTDIDFLDEARKEFKDYEVITSTSPEGFYEIVWANNIDVAVFRDYFIDRQLALHLTEVQPFAEVLLLGGSSEGYSNGHSNVHLGNSKDVSLQGSLDYFQNGSLTDILNGFQNKLQNVVSSKSFGSLDLMIKKLISKKEENESANVPIEPSLYGILGPRAAGKTTVADNLSNSLPSTYKALRFVGRRPRPYEIQGEDHIFMSDDKIMETDFLKYRHKGGYMVGVDKEKIESKLMEGNDVLLTIAELDYFDYFSNQLGNLNPLMVISHPCDLENRMKLRDVNPGTLDSAIKDYGRYLDFAMERSINVIYNEQPWAEVYNPDYSPSYVEFKSISKFVKKARKIVMESRF